MTFETALPKEEILNRLNKEVEKSYWFVPYTIRNYGDNIKYGGTLSDNGFTITRKTRRLFHTSLIFRSEFVNPDSAIIDSTTIRTRIFPNPVLLLLGLTIFLWSGYLLFRVIMLDLSQYKEGYGVSKLLIPGTLFIFIVLTQAVSAFDELKYYKRFMKDIIEGR